MTTIDSSRADHGPPLAHGPYYTRTVGKAAAILEAFERGPDQMSLAEVCRHVRLNRATAYRLLATLAEHRLIRRSADGKYGLGLGLIALGAAAQRQVALSRVAVPHMHTLTATLDLTSFLSILDGSEALCLERIDGGDVNITRFQHGELLPLHVGAGPLLLLAGLPDEDVDLILSSPRVALTRYSVIEPNAIRTRIKQVRADGVAFSDQDVTVGVGAIGAPIRDTAGVVVAAVSVSAVVQVLFGERQTAIMRALQECAAAIGAELA